MKIKILHSFTKYDRLDTWGISSEIKKRTDELKGKLGKEKAFKQAVIEKSKRVLNG